MSEVSYQLVIKHLAGRWQLTEKQYRSLMHLGPTAVPELIRIDTTLKQLFAASPMLADLWITTRNTAFGDNSPMDLIEREEMAGLRKVVQFLCLER